jgi:hypothetical protein
LYEAEPTRLLQSYCDELLTVGVVASRKFVWSLFDAWKITWKQIEHKSVRCIHPHRVTTMQCVS